MTYFRRISLLFFVLFLWFPVAANAESIAIQNLSPGATVPAKNMLTFKISPTGFTAYTYQLKDSFSNSTVTVNNIDPGGNFSWVPVAQDAGTHNFTITGSDYEGHSATASLTVIVTAPPSVSIQSVSPSGSILAGQTVTFTVVASGFTNPTYIVGDQFAGSSVNNSNLDSSGHFSWKPDIAQNGDHTITIYVSDSLGRSASASQFIRVGSGPTLSIQQLSPGSTVQLGGSVTFTLFAQNYTPTGYSLIDTFAGSTLTNLNVTQSGLFSWTPAGADVGTHRITITGVVGAYGDRASTTQTITVLGPGMSTTSVSSPAPTSSASSTLLSSLQAQLSALMGKISAQGSGNTAQTPSVSNPSFTMYLKPGMENDEVLRLQQLLYKLGYMQVAPNGYYGPGTTAAVIKFQAEKGLSQLGVVGPATRAALNALGETSSNVSTVSNTTNFKFEHFMGYGDDDEPDVTELQKRLKSLGYLSESAPLGFYGAATEAAVKKFQAAHGLAATGYCDKVTRAELNK